MSKTNEAEGKLEQSEKALSVSKEMLKETFFHMAEVEKGHKNAESALAGYEKQDKEVRLSLKKVEI